MKRRAAFGIMQTLLLIGMLTLAVNNDLAFAYPTECSIVVPFYYQVNSYYCGDASLEMVFDFYGPDVSQYEIADAARAYVSWGTNPEDMRRASHFSNLSLSVGSEMPETIQGYSSRKLGYAAFEKHWMTLDDLKLLVSNGYPITVTMWYTPPPTIYGHCRVVVGYNETHIIFHDPWYGLPYRGPNVSVPNSQFLAMWQMFDYWGLFVSPWQVTISAPENVHEQSTFTVTATIAYPCPEPFSPEEYSASACNATLTLPEGLSFAPGETVKKTLGTSNLSPRDSATVSWLVHADSPGEFTFSVEAEGKVAGSVGERGWYPAYDYEDRIGGTGNHSVSVTPRPALTATVDINPQTLNLKSRGKWITAHIELPEGYNPEDIDASTILLNGTIQPVLDPKYGFVTNPSEYLVDHNKDGILDRMVKFDRATVESFICNQGITYGNVALTITGKLLDGTPFEGTDIISVKYAGDLNNDGAVNMLDVALVSAHWYPGPPIGPLGYGANADFNQDGTVDIADVGLLSSNWGPTVP